MNEPSHRSSRTAASTIASNTGCASVGDWLMTRRISDVAVWRSRAMRSSLLSHGVPDGGFLGLEFTDLDFPGLGLPTFVPPEPDFDAFSFEDFAFGIAPVRRGAVARFADFRPRLAMFPPVEA
jgi:hypothetical protein